MSIFNLRRNRPVRPYSELVMAHSGKTTDKWSGYLPVYDRLFAPLVDADVAILEIGVQNGGSLEIYGRFFRNARKIIGVDISEACGDLRYDDPRIEVIVGDATARPTSDRIFASCDRFDLIIDDGSHKSSDIIGAFLRYLPALKPGGLYIAEDLCCSYWRDWEGGLFEDTSSMSFFRMLPDLINTEHWGNGKGRADLCRLKFPGTGSADELSSLNQIYSVAFFNSMAVVTKADAEHRPMLGTRIVAGERADVTSHVQALAGSTLTADERDNPAAIFPEPRA